MNKPDWKDAPEWAQWLACDEECGWWWYQKKPIFDEDCWICDPLAVARIEHAGDYGKNPDTANTLEPRP